MLKIREVKEPVTRENSYLCRVKSQTAWGKILSSRILRLNALRFCLHLPTVVIKGMNFHCLALFLF